MSTYGLIGYPLDHSLSPELHNTAFEALGVDAVYKLFPLQKEDLASFFDCLRKKDSSIFGLNVTIPYKENVISFLDSMDPFAEKVGAVNTIVITDKKKLIGYNTDGPGFLAHLTEMKFNPENKRIAILGSGGSARAILSVFCLLPQRPYKIKLFARTLSRAQNLLDDLSKRMDTSCVEIVSDTDDLNVELADLLINTTSVGLKSTDESLIKEDQIHQNMIVYDLIYNPAQTPLLKIAEKKKAKAVNGLRMLYYQGVLAFQRWAQMELDENIKEEMWQTLVNAVNKRK